VNASNVHNCIWLHQQPFGSSLAESNNDSNESEKIPKLLNHPTSQVSGQVPGSTQKTQAAIPTAIPRKFPASAGYWTVTVGTAKSTATTAHVTTVHRVRFKLALLMYRCLHRTAPPYLMDSCTLTADVTGRQHLRSVTQWKLTVPCYRLNSFGRQRFAVAGPSAWYSLPDSLHGPQLSLNTFKRQLKAYIFTRYWRQKVLSALEIFWVSAI